MPGGRSEQLNPEAREVVAIRAAQVPADLAGMREKYTRNGQEFGPEPADLRVEEVVVPGRARAVVPARHYRPADDHDNRGVLVWLHGGAWMLGSLDAVDRTARALAIASGSRILVADYRLAPEHPYPAGLEDIDDVVRWMRTDGAVRLGHDPAKVTVGGDSSGGNLATVAVRHTVEDPADLPPVAAQVLVYPVTDITMSSASYEEEPVGLSAAAMAGVWDVYYGKDNRKIHPDVSPIHAQLSGMPPTLMVLAGHDVLREDGIAYARALEAAEVPVEMAIFDDLPHGFIDWSGRISRAGQAISTIGRFIADRLGS